MTPKPSKPRKVAPLGNRVILEYADTKPGETVRDGIIIPDSATDARGLKPAGTGGAYYVARVVAAGPDCKRVKVGNLVVADDRPFKVQVRGASIADPDVVNVWMTREEHISAILE